MNILQAVFLGLIEGITEFLPVSSTFHLIWTSWFLQLQQTDFVKLFEVFIQGGAILAVVFLYTKEILNNRQLFVKLLLSFIPTAVVGFLLYKVIKGVFFERIEVITLAFIIVGIIFLVVEYFIQKGKIKVGKNVSKLSYKEAVLVGVIQSLAVLPGVSRAGSVILGMMFLGYKRDESAKYSFMLSIPTILAASVYDLYKMRDIAFQSGDQIGILLIGFVAAFISAFFVIKWLIQYLQNNSLVLFGWYRIVVGIILLILLTMHP